jgi:ribosome maturation factor RimP
MNNKDKIADTVIPVLNQHNMELVDLVVGQYRNKTLIQFFIDRKEGRITLDDCQKMSEIIGSVIDMEQIVQGAYVLEVSSPGIKRPLTKPEHFKRFTGSRVKVELKNPVGDQHNFSGIIAKAGDDAILLDDGMKQHNFKYEQIKKARLDPVLNF